MTTSETAKEIVTILGCCKAEYKQRYDEEPSDEILCMLLDRTHRQMISNEIQKGKGSSKSPQQQTESKQASKKQLDYIEDLGGDPSTVRTSYEASQYIEELKKK